MKKSLFLSALIMSLSACSSAPVEREPSAEEIKAASILQKKKDTAYCQFEAEKTRSFSAENAQGGIQFVAAYYGGYDRVFNACMKAKGFWE